MSKLLKILLAVNAVLLVGQLTTAVWGRSGITYAQRPPDTTTDGVPYLMVNINPTGVPPMVNINPNQAVPKVEVTHMPDFRIPPAGCDNRQNFETEIGKSISGPMMVTYLNTAQQTAATLITPNSAAQSVKLGASTQLATAIYLKPDQKLQFDSDVMYSGCRPD